MKRLQRPIHPCPTTPTAPQRSVPVAVALSSGGRNGRRSGRRCVGAPSAAGAKGAVDRGVWNRRRSESYFGPGAQGSPQCRPSVNIDLTSMCAISTMLGQTSTPTVAIEAAMGGSHRRRSRRTRRSPCWRQPEVVWMNPLTTDNSITAIRVLMVV